MQLLLRMETVQVSDKLAFCEQPSFQELAALHERGFHTVVNVRLPTEQWGDEGLDAKRVGLRYVQLPIAQPEWNEHLFDQFRKVVSQHRNLPLIVHSAEGARAGILTLTYHAVEEGWTIEQLEGVARRLGLSIPAEARSWVYRHSSAYDAHAHR